ncbi:MAG: glycosyltransferase family 4 protein [Anaerolineales bacterium]|nr:glycosyltransferase family 4 protein [Anaerolineales bacterium]
MTSEPLRIMQVIARLNVGGPAAHVILLTEHFGPPSYKTMLVCGQIDPHEGDMVYLADEKGITPYIIPDLGRSISPIRDAKTIVKLYRLMRTYKPHVVHTHTAKAGFVGRIAAWLARVPVRVHTFHGHVFHGYFGKAKTCLFLWLERGCAKLSSRLITISPSLRDELVEHYHIASQERFVVLPLGIDLGVFAQPTSQDPAAIRQHYNLPVSSKLIGIVGRLVDIKNHALFLEAAHQVILQRQDVHFVVVGDGELHAGLEQQVESLNLQSYVTFIGWVKDLAPLLHTIDILALTSNNEGTPVSIIEAMAAGIPVVATAVGGVPDVLGGGSLGTLTPAHDPKAFADALIRVLDGNHPSTQEAQMTALERYSLERFMKDIDQLYRSLLA